MKLEIEIDGRSLVVLSGWASVDRTLNNVIDCLSDYLDNCPDTEEDRVELALSELKDLSGPLAELHRLVRTQMWQKACGILVKEMYGFGNDKICRLEKGHSGPCQAW
jgi:hypothetical protein